MKDLNLLSTLLKEAELVGKEAANKTLDVGTCNLDCVVVSGLDRVRETSLVKHGIHAWKVYPGSFGIFMSFGGQADKNAVGVQAARDYLKTKGVNCYIYYCMD